jgi:hypothetical protein
MLGALPNIFQNTPELLQFFRGEERDEKIKFNCFPGMSYGKCF